MIHMFVLNVFIFEASNEECDVTQFNLNVKARHNHERACEHYRTVDQQDLLCPCSLVAFPLFCESFVFVIMVQAEFSPMDWPLSSPSPLIVPVKCVLMY